MELLKYFKEINIPDEDKENFQNFLELKGVQRYKKIENALKGKVSVITYELLSHHYRYDIKLRRELFKCISLLEVSIKAFINNYYSITNLNNKNFVRKINHCFKKNNKNISLNSIEKKKNDILFRNNNIHSLFDYLENCDLSQLIKIVLLLSNNELECLFIFDNYLMKNLYAVRDLRNLVFHHILLIDSKLSDVYIEGKKYNDLTSNIKNLINLIPERARGNISKEINDCVIIDELSDDKSSENQYKLLKEFKIEILGGKNE